MSGRVHVLCALLAGALSVAGCAADGERATEPRTVRAATRDAPASLRYVEQQRLVRVFSPEGLVPTVRDFDIAYELVDRAGQSTPLPFLDARDADMLDVFTRVDWFAADQAWVAMSVRSTHHSEHVQGMQWRSVDDDFTTIRVTAFATDHLIARRDLRVCNPGRAVNPALLFDRGSRTLRLCARDGWYAYDAMTGQQHLVERTACCPSAAGTTDERPRDDARLVVDDAS